MVDFDEFGEMNEDLVFIGDSPEQYKDAILGVTHDFKHVVYSYDKLVECMMKENDWTGDEATDWIEYNTLGAIVGMGEYKPIVIHELIS